MTHDNTSRTAFRGSLLGIEYDDPAAFQKAARSLGFRPLGDRTGMSWREGTEVRVTLLEGTQLRGQVWARHPVRGQVWLALEDGRYAVAHCARFDAYAADGRERIGKVT